VAYTYTTIGGQSGAVDEATIFVRLHPRADREIHQTEIERAVRRAVEHIGGARIAIGGNDMGGGQQQIQLQIKGPDVDALMQLAERVAAEMRQVPGAADVAIATKTRRPEVEVEIDRELAGSFGIDMTQVAMALRIAFAGVDSGDWLTPEGDAYDVYVRLDPKERGTIADLESLPLGVIPQSAAAFATGPPAAANIRTAPMVPLGQIAEIKQGVGPGEIQRLDRERVVTVGANAEGRALSEVIAGINKRIAAIALPAGYTIGQGGEAESQAEVFGDMLAAMGMAVLLMYFVLVLQFESFLDPFAIMLSLPLSLIGVMLALAITRDTLNIMSMIGVLLLMGIVAKNAILLIDFAKWRTESGMPLRDALIEAGRIRLRPILMTSFALIAGMIPVAMGIGEGAEFRAPMGRAVIGGVVTSTLLTLIVIPSIYELMDKGRAKIMRRFRRTAHVPGAEVAPRES
jgi:HAE1 family hydrophobic/amphiphilic exporter-1